MGFTHSFMQVWDALRWFIPPLLLISLLKSPWAKGQMGELLVRPPDVYWTSRPTVARTTSR